MPIPAPFGLTTTSISLGSFLNTSSTTVPSAGITNTAQPRISEVLWYTPTTTLGTNITTLFTTVNNGSLITIPSAGTSPRYSFIVPSMSLGSQFSTFIYTSNTTINISAGGASAVSTQSWYTTSA
jgi:hypothetical protein